MGQMRTLTRLGLSTATIGLVTSLAGTLAIGTAAASPNSTKTQTVALLPVLRYCDFGFVATAPQVPLPFQGTGSVVMTTAGSSVTAEVRVVIYNRPDTHYDVGLIQAPRPSSAPCGPGDPGTAFAGLDTDAAGGGTVTIHDSIRPGTTGVWVAVQRPNPHSQSPAEYYSSEIVAPV